MNRLHLRGLILFLFAQGCAQVWGQGGGQSGEQGFTLSTISGAGFSSAALPAPALDEGLDGETGVAVDTAGNIYVGR